VRESLGEVSGICAAVAGGGAGEAEVVICPPATLLMAAAQICAGTPVTLGVSIVIPSRAALSPEIFQPKC